MKTSIIIIVSGRLNIIFDDDNKWRPSDNLIISLDVILEKDLLLTN